MTLDDYRTVFTAVSLVLILAAAFPGLNAVLSFPRGVERFSELWILGPERMTEGYPFNVRAGDRQGPVHIGVRNHMGCSQYYVIYVKLRNQTQPLPSATASKHSPLPQLYEFQFFLADDEMWETPLFFTIEDMVFQGDSAFIRSLSINDMVNSVNSSARWDSEHDGFYYQLFFELLLYDPSLQEPMYHNRFVGIWLNMTGDSN